MNLSRDDLQLALLRFLAGNGGLASTDDVRRAGIEFQVWARFGDSRVREVLRGDKWLAFCNDALVTVDAEVDGLSCEFS